jgi:hypothetical protein
MEGSQTPSSHQLTGSINPKVSLCSQSAPSPLMPSDGELNMTMASPCVPIELIDNILKFTLMSSATDFTTPQFRSIASVALASTTFRQVALRRYFRDITPETKAHWASLLRMLSAQDEREVVRGGKGAFIWVRCVYAHPSKRVRKGDLIYACKSTPDHSAHRQGYFPPSLWSWFC